MNSMQGSPSPVIVESSVQCIHGLNKVRGVPKKPRRALLVSILFCFIMMIVEAIFGLIANSLAIISDALHMFADVFALSISLFALYASSWGASDKKTFGWRRAEVVGALCSVFTTWVLVFWILTGAVGRSWSIILCAGSLEREGCEEINTKLMFGVGLFGLCMNLVLAMMLNCGGSHGHSHGSLGGDHFNYNDEDENENNNNNNNNNMEHNNHNHNHNHNHENNHNHNSHNHNNIEHNNHNHKHNYNDHSHEHKRLPVHEMVEADHLSSVHASIENDDSVEVKHPHLVDINCHVQGETQNMNMRAAMLHVFGDCLQSLGVVVAAGIIWVGNNVTKGDSNSSHSYYNLADPLLSLLFGIITIYTTLNIIKEVMIILLEQAPPSVEYTVIHDSLMSIENVRSIEDLHLWSVGPECNILSAHLCVDENSTIQDAKRIVESAALNCKNLGFAHTTIQINHTFREIRGST